MAINSSPLIMRMEEEEEKEYPADFRCPISMELMKDPVTICTGFTYERKNILKWFFTYNKKTCPATMQSLHNLDTTPNHTLKRLIQAWLDNNQEESQQSPPPFFSHDELVSLLTTMESSPFKVTSLKKLRSIVQTSEEAKADFIRSGGVEVVVRILVQVFVEEGHHHQGSDFVTFRASEAALAVLFQLPILKSEVLSEPDSMRSIAILLQRGSAEARLHAVTVFQKMAKTDYDWNFMVQDHQGIDFFKSLLELISDEICTTNASSRALDVVIGILSSSKNKSRRLIMRRAAIEAGALCVLVVLLPDSSTTTTTTTTPRSRSKCEKILYLIKLLCECAEGRQALLEHDMGIPAVSETLMHVSSTATKIGVKIMWSVCCRCQPTERVLEDMLMYGSVKKLLILLLHMDGGGGGSSTKDKLVKMFKLHAKSWRRYPCFPCELNHYLGLLDVS